MNSFFEQNNNYSENKHTYENIPSLDTYGINQEMNVIPKESIYFFSEKDGRFPSLCMSAWATEHDISP